MKTYINGHCIEQVLTNAVELTQAEYNALPAAQKSSGTYIITDAEAPNISATQVEYSTGVTVKDVLDDMNTLKTGTLEEGTYYSDYVGTVYMAKAEEKNGVVIVNILFTTGSISTSSSGWKEIFKLPSNITKPSYDQTVSIIMNNNAWGQIQVRTDGSIPLNSGAIPIPTAGAVYSANFIYFV